MYSSEKYEQFYLPCRVAMNIKNYKFRASGHPVQRSAYIKHSLHVHFPSPECDILKICAH